MDLSAAKSSFIRREVDVWGSLRSLRTSLAGATARLSQQGAEAADLRLLCTDLRAEAAAARAEAAAARAEVQRLQSEFDRIVNEWDQSRGRAAATESRAGALAADLAVAQVAASEQRARAGGTPWPSSVFVSTCFLRLCLRSFLWLFAELESALDESAKALAGAAEQREADHAAMSEAVSDFCRVLGSGDVPSGSSPQSRLQVLGDHVRSRLREALHHGVRRAFAVLASHYVVDLERVSEGYCLPDEDEAALAEVQRLDAAAAGSSVVLATTFEAEILPPSPSSEAGMDFAEAGDEAEGAGPSRGDA
jgi:hypothetical protein